MAEVLMRHKFSKRFGEMASQRVFVASAGLSAFPGGPASDGAQAVMATCNFDLSEHQSRSVTAHGLQNADLVLTMTRSHRAAILDLMPEVEGKVHLLGGSGDVSDPFGGSQAAYAACAQQIDGFLDKWVAQLDDSLFPTWANSLTA
jgi:protein-tyrosine phosphatase